VLRSGRAAHSRARLPVRVSFSVANLYARTVFFVADVDRSRRYYTEQLGFSLDWDSNDGVVQVSLFGFELILNQVAESTRDRVGHGRLFIGLEDDQRESLRRHIADNGIEVTRVQWGRPTLVIRDLDDNELFFWLPHDDFSGVALETVESNR
jgi:catechol 2,3-dioxygenase-like lactoylglutathione lyase family enzyme